MSGNSLLIWEDSFLKQIQSKAVLERKKESEFKNFILNIESTYFLPAPFENQTEQFLNDFSPKIIHSILDIRSISKNQEHHYTNILKHYTKILAQQIALEFIIKHNNLQIFNSQDGVAINNEKFIQAASKILINKKSNYFLIFTPSNSDIPPTNYQMISLMFATTMNLNLLTDYIQMESMQSLEKIELIIKLVALTESSFNNDVKDAFSMITAGKIWILIEPINPRQLNESNIDNDFTSLASIAYSFEAVSLVYQISIQFSMKILKSGLLAKQFQALRTINRICTLSPEAALPILKEENLLDYLLTDKFSTEKKQLSSTHRMSQPIDDIHFELLNDISEIFSIMYNHQLASDEQLKIIWMKTLSQSQTTIGAFFKGLEIILSTIPHEAVFKTIVAVNEFPNCILPFLQKISDQCPLNLKKELFNKLHDTFYSEKEILRGHLLIDTMICYIPNDDESFIHQLQSEYIENIRNNRYLHYSLKMLENTLLFLTQEKASVILNVILNRLDKDSIEYLDPLFKLISNSEIYENEFVTIEEKVLLMMSDHPKSVCKFYRELIDTNVISSEQALSIFQKLCSLHFNSEIFQLITHIFALFTTLHQSSLPILINKESLNHNEMIFDSIWKYLFTTNREEVVLFLVNLYSESNDPNKVLRFIESCSTNFNCVGSLEAVKTLIHRMEDGLSHNIKAPANRMLFTTDFITVNLIIEQETYNIKVPKDICFEGFQRIVSNVLHLLDQSKNIDEYPYSYETVNDSYFRIDLLSDESIALNPDCFNLNEGMKITIQVNKNDTIAPESCLLPFQVIIDHNYYLPLFEILIKNDAILSEKALELLNLIPTLPAEIKEFEQLNSNIQWNTYLSLDTPFLLIYRLNLICQFQLNDQTNNAIKLSSNNKASLNSFYQNGGIEYLLGIVFNSVRTSISDDQCLYQLMKITKYLINSDPNKNNSISNVQEGIPLFLQWILDVAESHSNEQLLVDMIFLINEMKSFLYDLENFPELIKTCIFNKLPKVRSIASSMAKSIPDEIQKYKILISLLKNASNTSRCDHYFDILSEMAHNKINYGQFWTDMVNSLYKNFQMPKDSQILNVLTFRQPPINYAHGLFKVLSILADHYHRISLDEKGLKRSEKLFRFMSSEIIFNQYKFYRPTADIFHLYQLVLEQNYEQSIDFLQPLIETIKQFKLTKLPENYLSSTARNRGIQNLGATCYINSVFQQLYNIPEFRKILLKCKIHNNSWLYELQYDFAQLWLLPTNYVKISNFIRCWRGYDNEIINPREPQDAAEFLQLLLDRLEQIIPSITEIFTGTIEHLTKGVAVSYERKSTEKFTIFPLEISNHDDISDSFKTFLYPERFECIEKAIGTFEALRYHSISKPPKVLIIQLKRFNYNLQTRERDKINSPYNFPLNLDLSPIMKDHNNNQGFNYDLCGVVHHIGSATCGHYFSDVKRETQKWLSINDSHVRKIVSNSFLANGIDQSKSSYGQIDTSDNMIKNSSNAYILFYKMRESNQLNSQDDSTVDLSDDSEIDSTILERLLKDIKDTVLRAVCSTPHFSQLVLLICRNDDQFEFLFKHTMNTLRITANRQTLEELINRCIEFSSSKSEIANYVLKNENDFNEFFLYSEHSIIRELYVKLIKTSLNNCSEQSLNKFYQFLFDELLTSSSIIYERYLCMGDLFDIFDLAIKRNPTNIDLNTFLVIFTSFVFYTIQDIKPLPKKGSIISIVNFSVAFEIIRFLISKSQKEMPKIEFESLIGSCSSKIFSSSFITLLTITKTKNSNFLSFLEFWLQTSQDAKILFNAFLDRCEREISIPLLAQMFNLSMKIADQELIIHFFAILKRRPSASIVLFFEILLPICQSNRHIFVCNALEWISKFLLSDDKSERAAISAFIQKLFDDVSEKPTKEPRSESNSIQEIDHSHIEQSKATIVIIYQYLVDSVKLLVNLISRLKTNMPLLEIPIDMFPTQEYFDLLTWTVKITDTKDINDIPIFVSLLKQFDTILRNVPKFGASYPQLHCLQFLTEIYGKKLFETANISDVISSIDKNVVSYSSPYYTDPVYSALNKLLIPILPNNPITYFRSNLYPHLLYLNYTKEAADFIESNANKSNVKIIVTQLWNSRILKQNCADNNINYLKTSWKLMNRFIDICNVFYDSQNFIYLYKLIQHKSEVQRAIAKFLTAFNFAYWTLYQNQKSMFRLKTQSLYLKYHENGFQWQEIFERIHNNEGIIDQGNGGLCSFLRSMIALKTNPAKKLLKLVTKVQKPLMTTAIPFSQTAKLICDLCATFPDSGEAINCMIREFSSINSSFGNVEVFCQEFAKMKRKYFWNDLQDPIRTIFALADDLDIAGETVLRMSEQLFDKKTLAQFRDKILPLIGKEIRSVIQSNHALKSVQKSEQKLNMGLVFILDLSSWIGEAVPVLPIEKDEISQYIHILQLYGLANTSDKFFMYLSQKMKR